MPDWRTVHPLRALREDLDAPTRWPALDGVRGIAIVAVVLYHAYRLVGAGTGLDGSDLEVHPIWWPAGTARFAIDSFFVLSGFLVVGSWRVVRAKAGSLWEAVREFGRRRGLRIVPAYWLSLVVLVPLVAPSLLSAAHLPELALLAGVQQYLVPGLPAKVNVVYWSLTTELHFYLLVPLLALLMARFGSWKVWVGAAALTVAWWAGLRGDMAPSLIVGRLDQFVIGAIAADLVRSYEKGARPALVRALHAPGLGWLLAGLLVALGTYHGSTMGIARGNWFDPFVHPLVGLIFGAAFVRVLTIGRPTAMARPLLRGLGLVSYSIYLWHYPLLFEALARMGLVEAGAPWAVVGAATAGMLALSVLVGVASYLLVERPFLRRKPGKQRRAAADGDLRPAGALAG